MGKRSRRRGDPVMPDAPTAAYRLGDAAGDELELRCVLTPRTRAEYAKAADPSQARAAATQDDVWARAAEFLFERLAVRWSIGGVDYAGPKELLARFRAASREERAAVRAALREHCAEWFPDVKAP